MKRYLVKPGQKVSLDDYDPDDTSVAGGKSEAEKESDKLMKRLSDSQELLYAGHKHKMLIVLQGMDTSGKDGTVRHVMGGGFNPASVQVVSFKKPTEEELGHDYLWRVHAHTPNAGEIVVFNRSHYEDVLVVRVHDLVPEKRWKKRYDHINNFEKLLADEGTTIVKFFLHISKAEQKKRLQERVDDRTKRWKFQHGDLDERKLWKQYMDAYEDALSKTSTPHAPWYVVPADRKWYRNYVVGRILADTLDKLDMKYPQPDLSGVKID